MSTWKLIQEQARKKNYRMLPKSGLRGRIVEIWPSKTEPNCFEMAIQWTDGATSIELSSKYLRVGAEIRH